MGAVKMTTVAPPPQPVNTTSGKSLSHNHSIFAIFGISVYVSWKMETHPGFFWCLEPLGTEIGKWGLKTNNRIQNWWIISPSIFRTVGFLICWKEPLVLVWWKKVFHVLKDEPEHNGDSAFLFVALCRRDGVRVQRQRRGGGGVVRAGGGAEVKTEKHHRQWHGRREKWHATRCHSRFLRANNQLWMNSDNVSGTMKRASVFNPWWWSGRKRRVVAVVEMLSDACCHELASCCVCALLGVEARSDLTLIFVSVKQFKMIVFDH